MMNDDLHEGDDGMRAGGGSGSAGPLARRGLIAGLAAAAVGVAVGTADQALAHDPDDVRLGSNSTANAVSLSNTTAGTPALFVQSLVGPSVYNAALKATGPAGLEAIGASYHGVVAQAVDPDQAGVYARNSSGSLTTGAGVTAFSDHIGIEGYGGPNSRPDNNPPPAGMYGVYGYAGDSTGIGGIFAGGQSALRLLPRATPGVPTSGAHLVGELSVSSDGRLFFCRVAGTPGNWIELMASPKPTLTLLPTPERFVDTRIGLGGVKGPVAGQNSLTFQMTGRNGQSDNPALQIPDSATAIVGNLTVLGQPSATPGTFLTIWPGGDQPTVSNINYGPSAVVANSFVVGLSSINGHGGVKVFNNSDCDYIIDVTGYYAP